MKRITSDLQARISQLYKNGSSISEIMQQLNLSRSFVYRVLGAAGQVHRSSLQRDMTPEILQYYFEGKTVYEVACELHISKSTVHRVVANADAVRPKKGSTNPAVATAKRKSVTVDGLKFCTGCEGWFLPERFPPSKTSLDGRRPQCLKCHEQGSHKWRKTPAGALYHKTKMRTYSKRVRQATPMWLTKEQRRAISAKYLEAVNKQLAEGVPYHVDHIYPINGVMVSGLHVPDNLQVVRGEENCRKGNSFDPDREK